MMSTSLIIGEFGCCSRGFSSVVLTVVDSNWLSKYHFLYNSLLKSKNYLPKNQYLVNKQACPLKLCFLETTLAASKQIKKVSEWLFLVAYSFTLYSTRLLSPLDWAAFFSTRKVI